MGHWEKKGLVFSTDHDHPWMVSHACVPTALGLDNGRIRLYFAPRNERGQSIPTFIEVDGGDPSRVLYKHPEPLLAPGELGAFDDGGIMPCSIVRNGPLLHLYYVGWNPSVSVPYRNAIGLALSSDDGLSFRRAFPGPVVDRNAREPFFTASPWVMLDEGVWRMWYASTTRFVLVDGKPEPVYVIKYAHSKDGLAWERPGLTCIEPADAQEANARPTVLRGRDGYEMWYCYRGSLDYRDGSDSYRIGYARSQDGLRWTRLDAQAGIGLSAQGWDSRMLAYPNVLDFQGRRLLFYNGNGFGLSGIGWAVWRED